MIKRLFNEQTLVDTDTEAIHLELDGEQITLSKKEGEKRAQIKIVRAGWNTNNYHFNESNLDEILMLMGNRPKIYLDHDYFGMGRSEKDWAATFEKVWKDSNEKCLMGEVNFTDNPNTLWIYNEIKKDPKNVQFSIDIQAAVSPMDTPDKKSGRNVEKVILYRSTDIVSYAAAGGEAVKILNQSLSNHLEKINQIISKHNKENEEMPEIIKSVAELKTTYPELIEQILNEDKSRNAQKVELETVRSENTSLKTKEGELTTQVTNLTSEKTRLEGEVQSLKNEKQSITEERDGLKVKVDAFEAGQKMAQWKVEIQSAVDASKIDKKLVTEIFMGELLKKDKIEDVKQLIEDRKSLSASPVIKNKSSEKVQNSTEEEAVALTDESLILAIKS